MKIKTGEGDTLKEMLIPYLKEKGNQERANKNSSLFKSSIVFIVLMIITFYFAYLFIAIILTVLYIIMFSSFLEGTFERYNKNYTVLYEIIKDSICSLYVITDFKEIIIEFGIYPEQFVKLPYEHKEIISNVVKKLISKSEDYYIIVSFFSITPKVSQDQNVHFPQNATKKE